MKQRESICGNLYQESVGICINTNIVFKGAPHHISNFNLAIYDCAHIDDNFTDEQEKAYIKEKMRFAFASIVSLEVEGDPRYIGCLYNLIKWYGEVTDD